MRSITALGFVVLQVTDADFHLLDVSKPITITVTVGELDDSLKSLETYGSYLRGFTAKGIVEDEPETQSETVLSVRLTVQSDLDPVWTLFSERAEAAGQSRFLTWSDRARIAPTRVGALADHNLAWRRGSILNRLSDERPDMTAALAEAARTARSVFGDVADSQLGGTLRLVEETAKELGISLSDGIKATLDAHSVSFTGGTIALHDADGVPLRALGTGSTPLLLAGLQRRASAQSSILLIDELEHGLEPHRIVRLLGSIGAKEEQPPIQAFITTHSPVTLRELRGDQLHVVRKLEKEHLIAVVGSDEGVQGTMRLYPEAFLAPTVVVCEGASEAGLLRGLDLFLGDEKVKTLTASGIALVDAKGVSQNYARARAFQSLGYAPHRHAVIAEARSARFSMYGLEGLAYSRYCRRMRSAARSPTMAQGAWVLPVVTRGSTEPSAIRRPAIPCTASLASTTDMSSEPIFAVPH